MTKRVFIILLLMSGVVKAQNGTAVYGIYTQYLKQFKLDRKSEANFVITKSTYYGRKYDPYVKEVAGDLRACLNGDKSAVSTAVFSYGSFINILKTDTSWIALIDELAKKMKQKFVIKNKFPVDLGVTVINGHTYKRYFGDNKNILKNWINFHDKYPKPAYLIDFSDIVSDSKHAVFYFAYRCGGLCGSGCLVLLYKEGADWKFLRTLHIWDA